MKQILLSWNRAKKRAEKLPLPSYSKVPHSLDENTDINSQEGEEKAVEKDDSLWISQARTLSGLTT
jgi:hypothetical protein